MKTCLYNGERAKTFNDVYRPPKIDVAHIKHYVTKTVEEYILNKHKRGYTSRFIDHELWVDNFFSFNKVTKEKVKFIEKTLNKSFPKYDYIFNETEEKNR